MQEYQRYFFQTLVSDRQNSRPHFRNVFVGELLVNGISSVFITVKAIAGH
jgi:hypothetical protein